MYINDVSCASMHNTGTFREALPSWKVCRNHFVWNYKDNFLSLFVNSCMLFNVTHQLAWFALASRSVHPLLTNCFSCWCAQSWRGAIWAKTPALLLALIVAGNLTESNHVGSELTTTSSEASGGFSFFCLPTFFVYELQFATSDIWHWFFIQFCK